MSDNTNSPAATVYYADWCPFCQQLISQLNSTDTPYALVDADRDVEASEWIKSVNDGNRIVPTVKFSDGTHATNPPAQLVRDKIAKLS